MQLEFFMVSVTGYVECVKLHHIWKPQAHAVVYHLHTILQCYISYNNTTVQHFWSLPQMWYINITSNFYDYKWSLNFMNFLWNWEKLHGLTFVLYEMECVHRVFIEKNLWCVLHLMDFWISCDILYLPLNLNFFWITSSQNPWNQWLFSSHKIYTVKDTFQRYL